MNSSFKLHSDTSSNSGNFANATVSDTLNITGKLFVNGVPVTGGGGSGATGFTGPRGATGFTGPGIDPNLLNIKSASDNPSGRIQIGDGATADGVDSIAIGKGADTNGVTGSIAIGRGASASGSNSIAIGHGASGTTDNSIAIGEDAFADKNGQISLNMVQQVSPAANEPSTHRLPITINGDKFYILLTTVGPPP